MSEQQEKADFLNRVISGFPGARVTCPFPLRDNKLTFSVKDSERNRLFAMLENWNWHPRLIGPLPQITYGGFVDATLFAIDIPPDGQKIADDRAGKPEELHHEVTQVRKYMRGKV